MTDYTRKQGENLKIPITFKNSSGYFVKIADDVNTPLKYFSGVIDNESTEVPFLFKYGPVENKSISAEATETAIFSVICYITADTTATMAAGSWTYSIKMSDTVDPDDTDDVIVLSEGTLAIRASLSAVSGATTYSAPSA